MPWDGCDQWYASWLSSADGTPSPYHRVSQMSYDNVDDLLTGIGSGDGQATIADLSNFATGGAALLVVEDDASA